LNVLNKKCYGANPTELITEYFQAWLHHVMGMLVISKDYGVKNKEKQNKAKQGNKS
jgi:hypothetical protein